MGAPYLPDSTATPRQAPASFIAIPSAYDRGYGRPSLDVRGQGYYLAVGSIASGIFALASTLMFFAFSGLSAIPAIMAIVCGVMGLRGADKPQPTQFSSRAKQYSWWGIVCGVLTLTTIIGFVALLGVFSLLW